jgi:hypothetical protein
MALIAFTQIAVHPSSVAGGIPTICGLTTAGNVFLFNANTCTWLPLPMTSTSTS